MSWNDDKVSGGFEGENVERFRVEDGQKDLIRIISDPVRYYSHSMDRKPYYITCRKEQGNCPACNEGLPRKQRVGCLIVHIGRKATHGGGEFKRVGLVKPWLFAKDRWFDIQDIMDNDPALRKDGAIKKIDLVVTCKGEQFQDMRISPTGQKSKFKKDMAQNLQEAKDQLDFYTTGMSEEKQNEALGREGFDDEGEMETLSDTAEDDVPFDVPEVNEADLDDIAVDDIPEDEEELDSDVEDIMADLQEGA